MSQISFPCCSCGLVVVVPEDHTGAYFACNACGQKHHRLTGKPAGQPGSHSLSPQPREAVQFSYPAARGFEPFAGVPATERKSPWLIAGLVAGGIAAFAVVVLAGVYALGGQGAHAPVPAMQEPDAPWVEHTVADAFTARFPRHPSKSSQNVELMGKSHSIRTYACEHNGLRYEVGFLDFNDFGTAAWLDPYVLLSAVSSGPDKWDVLSRHDVKHDGYEAVMAELKGKADYRGRVLLMRLLDRFYFVSVESFNGTLPASFDEFVKGFRVSKDWLQAALERARQKFPLRVSEFSGVAFVGQRAGVAVTVNGGMPPYKCTVSPAPPSEVQAGEAGSLFGQQFILRAVFSEAAEHVYTFTFTDAYEAKATVDAKLTILAMPDPPATVGMTLKSEPKDFRWNSILEQEKYPQAILVEVGSEVELAPVLKFADKRLRPLDVRWQTINPPKGLPEGLTMELRNGAPRIKGLAKGAGEFVISLTCKFRIQDFDKEFELKLTSKIIVLGIPPECLPEPPGTIEINRGQVGDVIGTVGKYWFFIAEFNSVKLEGNSDWPCASISWSVSGLPPGVVFDQKTDTAFSETLSVGGKPTKAGNYEVTVTCKVKLWFSDKSQELSKKFSVKIAEK
jgi:hypothetical protein